MDLPDYSSAQWLLAILAAFCAGVSKAGLAGLGMIAVMLMAQLIPGKASSGAVLPLLIFADIMAAVLFRQEILWSHIRRLAVPIFAGILAGCVVLYRLPDAAFKPVIGWMVLGMIVLQITSHCRPSLTDGLPHSRSFLWFAGILTGASTMVANAAGPIATIYLLLVGLQKKEFIATMAWLFLFVNLLKVPFGIALGLISVESFTFNLVLLPAVLAGLFAGRRFIAWLPQRPFLWAVLAIAVASAVKLIWFPDTGIVRAASPAVP